jgi:hypothetical protein
MNSYQETILDRLMVAEKIGAAWKPGPLRLAVEALRQAGLTKRRTPTGALGYPDLLCRALEGASATLKTVEEVRALAITLFSDVPPGSEPPALGAQEYVEAARWAAGQVSALDPASRAATAKALGLIDAFLAGKKRGPDPVGELSADLERAIRRVTARPGEEFSAGRLALSACYFGLHAARRAADGERPDNQAELAVRDAARLAALVQGPEGAVRFCMGLARQIGM